jgi:hypothetical protein
MHMLCMQGARSTVDTVCTVCNAETSVRLLYKKTLQACSETLPFVHTVTASN